MALSDTPVDQTPDPAGQPPGPAQGAGVPDALSPNSGASAPQADVVSLSDAKRRRAAAVEGPAPPPVPPPPESAIAQPEGSGGEPGEAKPAKKREKTIDWGKFNDLVENFWLIYGTDTVWDERNRLIMKISNMAHAHGSDLVKLWKGSINRRTVMPQDVVFDPTETCGDHCVNLFGGFELEPKAGDVKPFLELANFLCSRTSEDADECSNIVHWLLCWLAYPLQHPGAKLRTAVVMHGDEGAGKNFLFECVLEIYGRYGALVGQDELEDKFNDWRSGKCMVIGDEVSSAQELVHNKNRLKALITSPTVQINPKNLPRREEKNHINIVFFSNELKPLALDNSDRRYLVVYTPRPRERSFYEQLLKWREAGGIQALYHYLLNYPLDDFDPYAPAPFTQAKANLIDLNLKSPERFWLEWATGEIELPYRTCSSQQLYRAYCKWAARIGDRWPVQRNLFTAMVVRISEARASLLDPPQHAAKEWRATWKDDLGERRTSRLVLVADLPAELASGSVSAGDWAKECVKAFEKDLMDYIGVSFQGKGEPGDGPKGGEA